ncbi:MAG TPA: VOC family protein [Polyangiaceae bacterium]|nr:VOC family protein [Polyangiaceae bacterium]
MTKVTSAVPIVRVSDFDRAIHYYCRILGFKQDGVYRHAPEGSEGYAFLSRDDARVHVSSYSDGVLGHVVYFYVDGIDALHSEWRNAGAEILYDPAAEVQEPGNQPWGMREIHVKDPDGNVLRFGQRIEA